MNIDFDNITITGTGGSPIKKSTINTIIVAEWVTDPEIYLNNIISQDEDIAKEDFSCSYLAELESCWGINYTNFVVEETYCIDGTSAFIFDSSTELLIDNLSITNSTCQESYESSSIHISSGDEENESNNVTISNSIFKNTTNKDVTGYGVIYGGGKMLNLTLSNTTFTRNYGYYGGAITFEGLKLDINCSYFN